MRNRPHFGQRAEAILSCPGKRSFPNIASTAIATRKRETIFRITSEAKARVGRALLDSEQSILRHLRAEA